MVVSTAHQPGTVPKEFPMTYFHPNFLSTISGQVPDNQWAMSKI